MRTALLGLLLLWPAIALADDHVYGIPKDSKMTTWVCPTDRAIQPTRVSSQVMLGRWSHVAHSLAHDGQANIIHREDGVEIHYGGRRRVLEMNLLAFNPRQFMWHPDSRRVAFWAPLEQSTPSRRIGLLDVRRLEGKRPWTILYAAPKEHIPFGMEWSPRGDALFVIERLRVDKVLYSVIARIAFPGGERREIVRMGGSIDFFMPPTSRFESGLGPSPKPFFLLLGHPKGLFLTGPSGEHVRRVSRLPSTGLHNLEWHPSANKVLLFFKYPVADPTGRKLKGVYLVDLDAIGKIKSFLTSLYEGRDVHTLWFSPQGEWISWSNKESIRIVPTARPASKPITIQIKDAHGELEDLHAFAWHPDGRRLALTAGRALYVYDVKRKALEKVMTFKRGFAARPRWLGDRVYVTVYEDISRRRR